MSKKEAPWFLKQKAMEVIEKEVFALTGKKVADFDTEEKRRELRRISRLKERWVSLMFVAWLFAALSLFVYSNLSKQPHPDVIRTEGVIHEGTVIKRHFSDTNYIGGAAKHNGGSFVRIMLDDRRTINEIITPEILEKLRFEQKVKVWEYDGRFWVDEEGNLNYHDPLPLLIIGLAFLVLGGLFCFLSRRRKIVL